jgi:photosystem II cytochrome c550
MLKRLLLTLVVILLFVFQFNISTANALELTEESRTVQYNDAGDEIVLTLQQVKKGERIFVDKCSYCHKGGATKTNPNVNLSSQALTNAEPNKNNIAGIVEYLKNPTTYDGDASIYEFHPNLTRSDLYPMMRNLTDDDLEAVAGYILIQPGIRGTMWGGGKVYS